MYICLFIKIIVMTKTARHISFAFMTSLLLMMGSCEKPDSNKPEPEERKNFFTFETYSFDINSVVKYDKGDNAIELWLSPESGLTTTSQIEKSGDYVVLNTHASYLGSRDRFNAQTSADSYIRFGNDLQYEYGDAGVAYIEVHLEGDQITLDFLAQSLNAKATEQVNAQLHGSYSGTYVTEKEKAYENEWGVNRQHTAITDAIVTTREDGGNSSITLIEADGSEGIRIELPHSSIGKEYHLTTTESQEDIKLYTKGSSYILKGAAGTINTYLDETTATVSISLVKDGIQLRVEYNGAYKSEKIKLNRFIFDYEGESPYEGNHEIVKLMVEDKGGVLKIFFSPSEGYNIAGANSTHMPILTLSSSVINAGKKTFNELTDWEFAYDVMQVWPFVDEYRPHPADTDWIEVNRDGNVYEIEFVLTSQGTGSQTSTIDVYYQGEAR